MGFQCFLYSDRHERCAEQQDSLNSVIGKALTWFNELRIRKQVIWIIYNKNDMSEWENVIFLFYNECNYFLVFLRFNSTETLCNEVFLCNQLHQHGISVQNLETVSASIMTDWCDKWCCCSLCLYTQMLQQPSVLIHETTNRVSSEWSQAFTHRMWKISDSGKWS